MNTKQLPVLLFAVIFAWTAMAAAGTHQALLTWTDTQNPTGTTYSVYRATGLCSGTPAWSKIASAVAVLTYTDTTVQPGNYCYTVSATFNGMESAQSNTAAAPVPSFAPAGLSVQVQ